MALTTRLPGEAIWETLQQKRVPKSASGPACAFPFCVIRDIRDARAGHQAWSPAQYWSMYSSGTTLSNSATLSVADSSAAAIAAVNGACLCVPGTGTDGCSQWPYSRWE